ncbi:DNA-directed RNA polymerase subunit H [Candidatus Woesearchaeota archaeon]|nr:DNA-directed RNA polymerase subunit H [Candidatus Woesearchaeota archaeon]
MASKHEPLTHVLIPQHEKISDKEKEALFQTYNITIRELPKIFKNDPAIAHLDAKENDVIKIERKSTTAGASVFYRGVINE